MSVGDDGEVYPYTNLNNSDAFEASVETGESALKPHVTSRKIAVEDAFIHRSSLKSRPTLRMQYLEFIELNLHPLFEWNIVTSR